MRPTIVFEEQVLLPDEFERRVLRSAAALRAAGIGEGDVVAMLMRNCPEAIEIMVATRHLGAQWCPINWHFKTDEVRFILADSGARLLIADAALLAALDGLDLARAIAWTIRGSLTSVPQWEPRRDAIAPYGGPPAAPRGGCSTPPVPPAARRASCVSR